MNAMKSQRLARAWSQEQLAELSSLSVRTIQRIENGERASLETLSAIAAAFDINVAVLMEPMEPDETSSASGESLEERIVQAKAQVRRESRFWRSLLLFIPVNALLFAINQFVNPQQPWFWWPLLIWGGVLVLRAVKMFLLRDRWSRWEQRRLQKILRKP
ncbi:MULTISPECIES: 2TM domain-containing protein [Dickeya]|uniref:HTH cro/C1-type domain-containing protein n=1 Tax=Dickeya aquatica TaxID=1401087 RepID=A0A375A5H3_9GAMM|nr:MULTISPECIES: 2TM domain-containing protein [Dickeya]SLM61290.1 FIG00613947: hypothetical protein [Dickeya aquatica]